MRQKRNYWWFAIYLGGFKDQSGAHGLLQKHNLLEKKDETPEQVDRRIQELAYHFWGDSIHGERYPQIYKQMEAISLD